MAGITHLAIFFLIFFSASTASGRFLATCNINGANLNLGTEITNCCTKNTGRPLLISLGRDTTSPPFSISDKSCDNIQINLNGHTISAPSSKDGWNGIPTAYFELVGLTGVTVTNGVINGNGNPWWTRDSNGNCAAKRPNLVMNSQTDKVTWSHLTLENPPKFHLVPSSSKDTVIEYITIHAPYTAKSCNLDGIDPSGCDGVTIKNCDIHSGDDDVAVKPGTSNVMISDCTFRTGHGASIGSVQHGTVSNVTFKNITFVKTSDGSFENGARIKAYSTGSGSVSDITFSDFNMNTVDYPIIVDTTYSDIAEESRGILEIQQERELLIKRLMNGEVAPGAKRLVEKNIKEMDISKISAPLGIQIQNVKYINFKASNTPSSKAPKITCSSSSPCTKFYFENIVLDKDITCQDVSGTYGKGPFTPASVSKCLK